MERNCFMSHERVEEVLVAFCDFSRDHETLERLHRSICQQACGLRKEILLPKKDFSRKERSRAYRVYAENLRVYANITQLTIEAIEAHREILAAAKEKKSRDHVRRIFRIFQVKIMEIHKKQNLIGIWFKDLGNVLQETVRNAENLQRVILT